MARIKETVEVKLEGKEKPRNLLIFMDGTWNDENGRNNSGAVTNIYKMFSSLSGHHESSKLPHKKSTAKHLGLYFRGVGNDEENIQSHQLLIVLKVVHNMLIKKTKLVGVI